MLRLLKDASLSLEVLRRWRNDNGRARHKVALQRPYFQGWAHCRIEQEQA